MRRSRRCNAGPTVAYRGPTVSGARLSHTAALARRQSAVSVKHIVVFPRPTSAAPVSASANCPSLVLNCLPTRRWSLECRGRTRMLQPRLLRTCAGLLLLASCVSGDDNSTKGHTGDSAQRSNCQWRLLPEHPRWLKRSSPVTMHAGHVLHVGHAIGASDDADQGRRCSACTSLQALPC